MLARNERLTEEHGSSKKIVMKTRYATSGERSEAAEDASTAVFYGHCAANYKCFERMDS